MVHIVAEVNICWERPKNQLLNTLFPIKIWVSFWKYTFMIWKKSLFNDIHIYMSIFLARYTIYLTLEVLRIAYYNPCKLCYHDPNCFVKKRKLQHFVHFPSKKILTFVRCVPYPSLYNVLNLFLWFATFGIKPQTKRKRNLRKY